MPPLDPPPNTAAYIRTEAPHWCGIEIWQSADFYEAVPQMIDGSTGAPLDLDSFTSLRFDLWIRSEFDYTAGDIAFLTSAGNDGIYFDDRANGLISIQRDRAVVNTWPIGEWVQWLNMLWNEPGHGDVIKTLWRGPCIIRPGKTA